MELDPREFFSEENVQLNKHSLQRWCRDIGGEFEEESFGVTTGRYECRLSSDVGVEVQVRSSRPNVAELNFKGGPADLGLAPDIELAQDNEGDTFWVESPEMGIEIDTNPDSDKDMEMSKLDPRPDMEHRGKKRQREATMF